MKLESIRHCICSLFTWSVWSRIYLGPKYSAYSIWDARSMQICLRVQIAERHLDPHLWKLLALSYFRTGWKRVKLSFEPLSLIPGSKTHLLSSSWTRRICWKTRSCTPILLTISQSLMVSEWLLRRNTKFRRRSGGGLVGFFFLKKLRSRDGGKNS